jgi:hypothetical protein
MNDDNAKSLGIRPRSDQSWLGKTVDNKVVLRTRIVAYALCDGIQIAVRTTFLELIWLGHHESILINSMAKKGLLEGH